MPFVMNAGPFHVSINVGGMKVDLEPGQTKRLKSFRHPTTGDVVDQDYAAMRIRQKYPESVRVFDDEELDKIAAEGDERLEEIRREQREALAGALQRLFDEFNTLNTGLALEGKPALQMPKHMRKLLPVVKELGAAPAVVSDEQLEAIRQNAEGGIFAKHSRIQALAEAGDLEGIRRVLAEEKAEPSRLAKALGQPVAVEPLPSPAARRRAAHMRPPTPPARGA